ncbi:MAG: PQQ-dependent sugar dehydrogenase [bacterium]
MSHRPLAPRSAVLSLALCAVALGLASPEPRAQSATRSTAMPDRTRFTRTVLVDGLNEPMQLEFDQRGRVYWIERPGALRRLDEATGKVDLIGTVPVALVGEAGLIGVLLARDFETTRQLYVYYSAPGDVREMHLSRLTITAKDSLDLSSEIVMMRWPHEVASHMGGGMTWDANGNLYVTVGDNSNATQYNPIHWTNERGKGQDSQRSAANSNDLRGKILRIHPESDGTCTIPKGNLFAPGTPNTRPEIFTMGNRNPWRVSIDSRTGDVFWGEVGPDAGKDSAGVGPMGYDEFNVARSAGFYGWPYAIGYNRVYNAFDVGTRSYGPPPDAARLTNASPNNTGLRDLPPARPALLAYPYGVSTEYGILGSGGRCAVGGPLFRRANFAPDAKRVFPSYYEGKWFVTDCVRSWIIALTPNAEHTAITGAELLLANEKSNQPLDLDFGPSGDLYVMEYDSRGPNGRLSKIEYNAGNRAPRVIASVDRAAGATPLRIALSAKGTVDDDGDPMRYEWVVRREGGGAPRRFTTASPVLTLVQPGVYTATLTATDAKGATGTGRAKIVAGNEPPHVALSVTRGNRSFYFPNGEVEYRVSASDREDGRRVAGDDVSVTLDYVPSGMTPQEMATAPDLPPTASLRHTRALAIIARNDCNTCHTVDRRLVGPAFREVAMRNAGQAGALERVAQKIVTGGGGIYGAAAMPAHPALTPAEATTLAQYALSLTDTNATPRRIPLEGSVKTPARPGARPGQTEKGSYVLRATYTDAGANGVAPITSSDAVLLRYPLLAPESAEIKSPGIVYNVSNRDPGFVVNSSGSYMGFRGIDLTGIASIEIGALTRFYTWSHFKGGTAEVRLDSPTGHLVGAPATITPPHAVTPSGQFARGDGPSAPVVLGANLEKPVSVVVSGVTGVHDVYIVFRNPRTGPADALMLITGIEFKPASSGSPAQSGAIPAGFTPIFNGRTLAGWHISRTTHHGTTGDFRVEDGVIALRQRPYGQGGLLLTDRKYRNFELYLEAKPDWGTNGGIFFRSSEGGSAYQIELVGGGGSGTGNLLGEVQRVTTQALATDVAKVWKQDDWNSFRLRVHGDVPHVTLWINGVQMYDVQAKRNDLIADRTDGFIALQSHWTASYTPIPGSSFDMSGAWKPGAAHRYRNIAIKVLP